MGAEALPEHQQAVDRMLAQVRAEQASAERKPLFKPAPERLEPSRDELDHRIAEELETIRRRLDQLGSVFAGDPFLVHRHATQLQAIDLVNQQLGHLAAVVSADDKSKAASQVSLEDLRQRLNRRALRTIAA